MKFREELDELREDLNNLHFVITEPDNPKNRDLACKLFAIVFDNLIKALALLLDQNGTDQVASPEDILAISYARSMFNRQTFMEMKQMAENRVTNDLNVIYPRLRENDARLLQMMVDMLSNLGEEYSDEE